MRVSNEADQATGPTNMRARGVDDSSENVNATVASDLVTDEYSEDLEELESMVSRVEAWLSNSSVSSLNITDVEILVENAKAFIEDAKALADESPDVAKEQLEAAKELLDDAMDLIARANDENSTNPELTAEQPDDVELTS